MKIQDEIAAANQRLWDEEVRKKGGYTVPWLDLNVDLIHQYAHGQLNPVPYPLYVMYPPELLLDVEGKDVLCLASGGGQQSAVFGLLGARVTVVDLSKGQLNGDETAAKHYGYRVNTVQTDMRDLSCLEADSFDMVHQMFSISWVPNVREVYEGVARLTRTDGIYQVGHWQPAVAMVEWNGENYCVTKPYAERMNRGKSGEYDFRHYMDDIFNGLLDSGFSIQRIHEGPFSRNPDCLNAEAGIWDHQMGYVAGDFAIVARKQ
jgi:SAM-dependent methyltransferase